MGIKNSFGTQYKSYKKEREKEITNKLRDGVSKAGAIVERQAKINVSKSPPQHPQVQTNELRSSIGYRVDTTSNEIIATVGTNIDYGAPLEFGHDRIPPYPWLFPALEEKKDDIKQAIKEGGGILL